MATARSCPDQSAVRALRSTCKHLGRTIVQLSRSVIVCWVTRPRCLAARSAPHRHAWAWPWAWRCTPALKRQRVRTPAQCLHWPLACLPRWMCQTPSRYLPHLRPRLHTESVTFSCCPVETRHSVPADSFWTEHTSILDADWACLTQALLLRSSPLVVCELRHHYVIRVGP